MPEYLAPGVYVEETSFRAKSIEGVGTSTTAFVGPARRGPIALGTTVRSDLPEILTSFADFVRLYGGLDPLSFSADRPNYLAQSAFNYFNEGGVRLYVMRVAGDPVPAQLVLRANANAAEQVTVRSRFSGSGSNGQIVVREIVSPATAGAFRQSEAGSLARAHSTKPSEPASIVGNAPAPFNLPLGSVLRVQVGNDAPIDVTFHALPSQVVAGSALVPVDLSLASVAARSLVVHLDAAPQTVVVPANNYTTAAQLLAEVTNGLQGAAASLDAGGNLVIATNSLGHAHAVQVDANANFGFAVQTNSPNVFDKNNNNVGKLEAVTAAEIQVLLDPSKVVATELDGRLQLSTPLPGETQTLEVLDATAPNIVSAHAALGLPLRAQGEPRATGNNIRLFRKADATPGSAWTSADAVDLALPADDSALLPGASLLGLSILVVEETGEQQVYDDVSFAATSARYLGSVLPETPPTRAQQLGQLYWFDIGSGVDSLELHQALFPDGALAGTPADGFTATHQIIGGDDGTEPIAGVPTTDGTYAAALEQLRAVEDVSIVAAPGHSSYQAFNYQAIQGLLIAHASQTRAYRIAVLDSPPELTPSGVRAERSRIDSTRAAFYYPWVVVANPLARPGRPEIPSEITLPPSGFVCGIYARSDVEQGVAKAPANEVVRGALRFESDINFAQQQVLNPLGINCLRYLSGRGYRIWGARTASSDPEWKYVNVRRYFLYLEASIDGGTQWAVFENNGPRLWANIRETIEDFLYNEWVSGSLLGATPKEAYFVRCDRSTMTQNDLDNGRLICLIGVAALKPAEFVIFRIGQKTADERT